jgi:hypothetical protein
MDGFMRTVSQLILVDHALAPAAWFTNSLLIEDHIN